jgi:hypothetical protein
MKGRLKMKKYDVNNNCIYYKEKQGVTTTSNWWDLTLPQQEVSLTQEDYDFCNCCKEVYNANDIVNVEIPCENKVVIVTFADGTKIKTVCDEQDTFTLEMAISIAITKKLLGGTGAYNRAIKQGINAYKDRIKAEEKQAENDRIYYARKAKKEAKRKLKEEKKREQFKNDLTSAIVEALKTLEK